MSRKWKFIQINLHHSKAATAILCRKLATGEIDIALIQEPWVYGNQIRGLHNIRGTLFSAGPGIAPRTSIFVRNTVHAFPLSELCSRAATMVRVTYRRGGSKRELIVTSAYLPYDSNEPPPSKRLRKVVDYCSRNKLQLIIGCDANAHHIIWGSTDINPRGECLMGYLA
jgi:splicing factor 45